MEQLRSTQQEAAEDVFFGQVVMIWARWFLIAAGVMLTLWVTQKPSELAVAIVPVVVLVAVNFYLHGRYLIERPANPKLIAAVGLVDLGVITAAVLFWPGGKGIFSPFFVLYFPVILAFAFVMPRKITLVFTTVALVAYVGTSLLAESIYGPEHLSPRIYGTAYDLTIAAVPIPEVPAAPSAASEEAAKAHEAALAAVAAAKEQAKAIGAKNARKAVGGYSLAGGSIDTLKVLLMRLITLAAMGGLGTYYWRIQRDRRRASAESHSNQVDAPVSGGIRGERDLVASGVQTSPVA